MPVVTRSDIQFYAVYLLICFFWIPHAHALARRPDITYRNHQPRAQVPVGNQKRTKRRPKMMEAHVNEKQERKGISTCMSLPTWKEE